MSVFEAIILGIAQGITEFAPVSSSGHLVLLQKIFRIEEPALIFDTFVHIGTLAAVFAVLWRDIWGILRKIIQPLTLYLIIATLPAVAAALLFSGFIERAFASGSFLGFCFLITTALLLAAEFLFRGNTPKPEKKAAAANAPNEEKADGSKMTWLDALVIGLLQAAAIAPGISRSGATLAGGLSRRLNRDFAARFSFILSIPAILGALVFQFKDIAEGAGSGGIGTLPIIAGTLTAAVTGFFAIKFVLKIVRERSLAGFAVYTAVLGVLVLADRFGTRLFFK